MSAAELSALATPTNTRVTSRFFAARARITILSLRRLIHLVLRGEFYTAYTPYQPEVSQGTLQAIFEYQSMMCALTGMDAANASHYDGATSLAEAVTVALEVGRDKRNKVILSPGINPQYREVVRTYHQGRDIENLSGDATGKADIADLIEMLDDNTAMLAVQYPNFFGQIDDFSKLVEKVHQAGRAAGVCGQPDGFGIVQKPRRTGCGYCRRRRSAAGHSAQFWWAVSWIFRHAKRSTFARLPDVLWARRLMRTATRFCDDSAPA